MPLSAKAIGKAQDCYQRMKSQNITCGGCHLDRVCGMGRESAYRLAELMSVIDPAGLNVTMVRLGPLGEESEGS